MLDKKGYVAYGQALALSIVPMLLSGLDALWLFAVGPGILIGSVIVAQYHKVRVAELHNYDERDQALPNEKEPPWKR